MNISERGMDIKCIAALMFTTFLFVVADTVQVLVVHWLLRRLELIINSEEVNEH